MKTFKVEKNIEKKANILGLTPLYMLVLSIFILLNFFLLIINFSIFFLIWFFVSAGLGYVIAEYLDQSRLIQKIWDENLPDSITNDVTITQHNDPE